MGISLRDNEVVDVEEFLQPMNGQILLEGPIGPLDVAHVVQHDVAALAFALSCTDS